jgi:hypothetical protein
VVVVSLDPSSPLQPPRHSPATTAKPTIHLAEARMGNSMTCGLWSSRSLCRWGPTTPRSMAPRRS